MKMLVIAQHATYSYDHPGVPDVGHPLTRLGRKEAGQAASKLSELKIVPDLVLTSHAERSRETGRIVLNGLKLPAERLREDREIYEAERAEVLRIVHRQDDAHDVVMLIGHNPGMSLLLDHLVDCDVQKMSPGAFAVVSLDADHWSQVSFKKLQLLQYFAPEVRTAWWQRFAFLQD